MKWGGMTIKQASSLFREKQEFGRMRDSVDLLRRSVVEVKPILDGFQKLEYDQRLCSMLNPLPRQVGPILNVPLKVQSK